MAAIQGARQQRFLLSGVDWKSYVRFLRALDHRHVRLTYDRGELELMTLSFLHEWYSAFLGRLIQVLTEELNWPMASLGSTTLKLKKRQRGLEPDKGFYLKNESSVRTKSRIDLRTDPPPDLALEIDISHSSLNRMGIYAALRIPEVWRFDGQSIYVHLLGPDGQYHASARSLAFPFLPMDAIAEFLQKRNEMDETSLIRSFRDWVKAQIAGNWKAS